MSTTFHFQFAELAGRTLTSELRNAATNALINTAGDEATDVDGWFTFVVSEEVPAGFYRIDALLDGVQQGAEEYVLVAGDGTEFWANNYLANINRPLSTLATTAGVAAAQGVITDAIGNLHDFDPTSDTVARVTLVDTCTSNIDMRGTDGAVTSLAGVAQQESLVSGVNAILEDTGTTLPGLIGSLNNLDSAAMQAAATAALTTYDPPTRAEAISDKSDVLAAIGSPLQAESYTEPPSSAANAAAVRSELATELGRIDAEISSRSTLTAVQVWAHSAASMVISQVAAIFGKLPTLAKIAGTDNSDGSFSATIPEHAFDPILEAIDRISPNAPGAFPIELTVKTSGGNLLAECDVVLTTSHVNINTDVVWRGTSDVNGVVRPDLDAGMYYGWRQKAGFTFSNPFVLTVESDGDYSVGT